VTRMLRHVVLTKYKAPLSREKAALVTRVLDDLGAQSPDVRGFSHGFDLGIRPNGFDHALVADFQDADGWKAYSAHPAHDVVRDVMRDIVESNTVVQFYVPDEETSS
jgi:hypothetical protein